MASPSTMVATEWLAGLEAIAILDDASVAEARQAVRREGVRVGLAAIAIERAAVVVSELARNHLRHAQRGWIALAGTERDGVPGLEVIAADSGPGIADPGPALRGTAASTASGLGVGLAGVRSHAFELDVDVRLGEGTCVRARIFSATVRRRREVGIFGRPHPHERHSGDGAAFVRRNDDTLLLAAIDGLGHGQPALEASRAAVAAIVATPPASTPAIRLAACDVALQGTRGAVIGIARIDEGQGTLELACAGNITTLIAAHRSERRLGCTAATVGSRRLPARMATEVASLTRRDALVLFTDGVAAQANLADEPQLLHRHPVEIARHLVASFGRTADDALVAVAR